MKTRFRTCSVAAKVTEEEYAHIEACASNKRLSISEWCRDVLLDRVEGSKADRTDEALLAEILTLRTILLNLHFAVAKSGTITVDEMQAIIHRADQDKLSSWRGREAGWLSIATLLIAAKTRFPERRGRKKAGANKAGVTEPVL